MVRYGEKQSWAELSEGAMGAPGTPCWPWSEALPHLILAPGWLARSELMTAKCYRDVQEHCCLSLFPNSTRSLLSPTATSQQLYLQRGTWAPVPSTHSCKGGALLGSPQIMNCLCSIREDHALWKRSPPFFTPPFSIWRRDSTGVYDY